MDQSLTAGLLLIGIFVVIVGIPCVGVSILGWKLAKRLSFYPSKTPAVQMDIIAKLVVLEIISFSLIFMLYHVLSDYGKAGY